MSRFPDPVHDHHPGDGPPGARPQGLLNRLRADENGAETAEIVLALVIFTIGMMAAFAYLRDTLTTQVTAVADCIANAAEESSC